jgi:hypothetical protein
MPPRPPLVPVALTRLGAALVLLAGCTRSPLEDPGVRSASLPIVAAPAAAPAPPASGTGPAPATPPAPPAPPTAAAYPWLGDRGAPVAVDALVDRFAPPPGFARVPLEAGSFGAWLRGLPLAAPGTPVVSYRGGTILPPAHDNLAAVVALDVGAGDLQQCADSVIRLHAEWLFAQGRRDQRYRAASGAEMPFQRWARGERMVPEGIGFRWTVTGRADAGHPSFRKWLDGVFAWANTGSLARDTDPVPPDALRPGDFVVQAGAPGHAVLVLDLARDEGGRRALLLGQGYMPAQSFQVLRPGGRAGPWFLVEPGDLALATPFWAPFPWKTLRRFPGA